MGSRYLRSSKKDENYSGSMDILIERIRKIRALNSDPSLVGMNRYMLKKLPFDRSSVLTKFL